MSSSSSSPIPIEWLRAFHKMERELFIRFVFNWRRDPIQSMQVIALWLWLEEVGFPNITSKLKTLSTNVVEAAIEESEACLNCLRRNAAGPSTDVPILAGLMERSFSLQFLRENRDAAIVGISSVLKNVCARIFEDLHYLATGNALQIFPTASDSRVPFGMGANVGEEAFPTGGIRPFGEGSSRQRTDVGELMVSTSWLRRFQGSPRRQGSDLGNAGILMDRGFEPRPRLPNENLSSPVHGRHGGLYSDILPWPAPDEEPSSAQQFLPDLRTFGSGIPGHVPGGISINEPTAESTLNPSAQPWAYEGETSRADRTMFLTFSRGYPLPEEDIRDFFRRNWGDCIQFMQMQEAAPGVQPLFARVVLHSSATVPLILAGQEKAKLVINGRHVWVRPFIAKKKRSPTKE